jgi:sec-independent protein translocase protein TatA
MFRNPTTDLIVVLVIVLLILGPKRLPGLGKSLGTGMREFKESITGDSKDSDEEHRPEIAAASANSEPASSANSQPAPSAPVEQQPSAADRGSAEVGSERRP